jgi:hypothetical protein
LKYANISAAQRKGFTRWRRKREDLRTAFEAAVMDDNAHPALSNDDLCAQILTWYFYLFAVSERERERLAISERAPLKKAHYLHKRKSCWIRENFLRDIMCDAHLPFFRRHVCFLLSMMDMFVTK